MSRRELQTLGICRGRKLIWWIKIRRKCIKAYGKDSKWDRRKLNGQCSNAWSVCNTGFYAVCCTQTDGPKDLNTYCDEKNLEQDPNADGDDKACQVSKSMHKLNNDLQGIEGAIRALDKEQIESPAPAAAPMLRLQIPAAPSPAGAEPPPAETEARRATPPPGLVNQSRGSSTDEPSRREEETVAALGPAVATQAPIEAESKQKRCDRLMELTVKAANRIGRIKR
jgi:hypothetical protein